MSTIASTWSSSRDAERTSANEARSTRSTCRPARSVACTAASTASFGAATSSPRTVSLVPGCSSGQKSSRDFSTGSGSASRTWKGSARRISLRGRLFTDISRTTTCGLVTPSTTRLVRNLCLVHRSFSSAVMTASSVMTPLCTTPGGTGAWPKLEMTGPSLVRPVSAARMDIVPMSSPINDEAAMRVSLDGGDEQGGIPAGDRAGREDTASIAPASIAGPNGIAVLPPARRVSSRTAPTRPPSTKPAKVPTSSELQPSQPR